MQLLLADNTTLAYRQDGAFFLQRRFVFLIENNQQLSFSSYFQIRILLTLLYSVIRLLGIRV